MKESGTLRFGNIRMLMQNAVLTTAACITGSATVVQTMTGFAQTSKTGTMSVITSARSVEKL